MWRKNCEKSVVIEICITISMQVEVLFCFCFTNCIGFVIHSHRLKYHPSTPCFGLGLLKVAWQLCDESAFKPDLSRATRPLLVVAPTGFQPCFAVTQWTEWMYLIHFQTYLAAQPRTCCGSQHQRCSIRHCRLVFRKMTVMIFITFSQEFTIYYSYLVIKHDLLKQIPATEINA